VQDNRIGRNAPMVFQYVCMVAVSIGIANLSGCGNGDRPPFGAVRGRITLDGKPLARAHVGFVPMNGGRGSSGVTDATGNYELKYIRDVMGAKIGTHRVSISTAHDRARKTETVPARYNVKSTLQKQVVAGDNVIDFDLTTR
jgi:hypothetical protein